MLVYIYREVNVIRLCRRGHYNLLHFSKRNNKTLNQRYMWNNIFSNSKTVFDADRYITESLRAAEHGHSRMAYDNEAVSTLYTVRKILSENMSKLPIEVYRDGGNGREKAKDLNLYYKLHYQPSSYLNKKTFFSTLEFHRNTFGNAFALINRNGRGDIENFEIIHPARLIDYDIIDGILYYKFKSRDGEEELDPINASDVLHFKGVSRDGVIGLNPLQALKLELTSQFESMVTVAEDYKNGLNQTMVLQDKGLYGKNPEAKQQAAAMVQDYGKSHLAGRVVPTPPGYELAELKKRTLADSEFISMMKMTGSAIASLYGVPPHLVGIYEASKFNNVEQLQLNFVSNTISSIASEYKEELESKLLTREQRTSGVTIEFDLKALLASDINAKTDYYRTLFNVGVLSPNQIADMEGLPRFKGGDNRFLNQASLSLEQFLAQGGINNNQE